MSVVVSRIFWSKGDFGGNSTWAYRASDPYCVHVVFHDQPDGSADVPWQLGRDLLIAGLDAPSGIGDARTWVTGRRYYLGMSTPSGATTYAFLVGDMRNFLRRTRNLVPVGAEPSAAEAAAEHFLRQLFSTGGAR